MDWPTAWQAAVPVYGLAAILRAIFPLLSAPVWVIFVIYAYKILDGARMAEDPWRGRGSPRPYLLVAAATLFVHLATYATILSGGSSGGASTASVTGVLALAATLLFLIASAPPGIRERRVALRMAGVAAVAGAAVAPAFTFGALPTEGFVAFLAYMGQIVLAAASFGALLLAGRRHSGATVVARKVPRA